MEPRNYEIRYFIGQQSSFRWDNSNQIIAKISPKILQESSVKIHECSNYLVFEQENLNDLEGYAHFFLYGPVGIVVACEEISFRRLDSLHKKEKINLIVIASRYKELVERVAVEFNLPIEKFYNFPPLLVQEPNYLKKYFNGVSPKRWKKEQIAAKELSLEKILEVKEEIDYIAGNHIIFKSKENNKTGEFANFFLYKDVGVVISKEKAFSKPETYSNLIVLSCENKNRLDEIAKEFSLSLE